uniref:DUF7869 domain-containing protein n=1 Tax=Chromera velia CCMP2878 TaxID=1169474 RepID=A0A0K6SAS1_9ALVE|eukprot:Cvel_11822.t1-p1 / transcript=Cvel_11822.t1 / gene=Cvel_11822 / organism=Chromera_velia_CCMP2878 / gene_product=hypothetical protein / transcript_product=hypothetical protein / location=Cvel_scaffold752:46575-63639(+) / protein_length=513 / sequence_SO=supercontig / SO=protein_coding / is_pseudo=false
MDQNVSTVPHTEFKYRMKAADGVGARVKLVAVLAHGRGKLLFAVPPQEQHGSNLTVTIINQALVEVEKKWPDWAPDTLWVQADNCTSENKNLTVLAYLDWLKQTGRFKNVFYGFLYVGHTHEDVDAFFGVLSKILHGATFFTIDDLFDRIRESFHDDPTERLFFYKVFSQYDWREWLLPHVSSEFKDRVALHPVHGFHFADCPVDKESVVFYKARLTDKWDPNNKSGVAHPVGRERDLSSDYALKPPSRAEVTGALQAVGLDRDAEVYDKKDARSKRARQVAEMLVTAPEVGLYGVTAKNVTENDQAPVWVFKVMQVLEDGNAVKGSTPLQHLPAPSECLQPGGPPPSGALRGIGPLGFPRTADIRKGKKTVRRHEYGNNPKERKQMERGGAKRANTGKKRRRAGPNTRDLCDWKLKNPALLSFVFHRGGLRKICAAGGAGLKRVWRGSSEDLCGRPEEASRKGLWKIYMAGGAGLKGVWRGSLKDLCGRGGRFQRGLVRVFGRSVWQAGRGV